MMRAKQEIAMVVLVSVTGIVMLATPLAVLLILVAETTDSYQARLHYHWLPLLPVTVLVFIWGVLIARWRVQKRTRANAQRTPR